MTKPLSRNGAPMIGRKRKEFRNIWIVTFLALLLAAISVSMRLSESVFRAVAALVPRPVVDYALQFLFLYLLGLLLVTYGQWRQAYRHERELENILSAISPDTLLVINQERKIVMCNPSLQRMFGYTPEEVLGRTTDLLYSDRRSSPKRYHEIYDEIEQAGYHFGQAAGRRQNGKAIPLEIISAELSGGGVVILLRDISDRVRAEEAMRQSLEKLRKATDSIINVIVMAVEARDPYTSGHQRRVADLARAIALEMGLPRDQIDGLRMAGIIHDLGKISVPSEILTMPRRLSEIEFDLVKTHAQLSHDLIKDVDFPWPIAEIILQHHERLDGSGYPRGLKGEAILLEAKILAVADDVEAISTDRPYRAALGIDKALEDISQGRGTLYDPAVVDMCLKLFREKGFQFEKK